MTDTLAQPVQSAPQPPRRGPAVPIAIAIAVVGGVVGVGTIVQGAAVAWPSPPNERVVLELSAADVAAASAVALDAGGADVSVAFADVDAATLTVEAPDAARWRLEMRGGTIDADDGRDWWSWGWGLGGGDGERTATLLLPESLAGELRGDLSIGSGSLDVSGDWRDLAVDLASGRAVVDASATSASVDVASGSASLDLVVDGDVALDLASGEIVAAIEHGGDLSVSVASGSVDGRLVGGPYEVRSDVAVGAADVDVEQVQGADQTIVVDVATGSVRLSDR